MEPLGESLVDVHELILQHFNAKDVIKYSLVSRAWYEVIGASRFCMHKIWLNIDRPKQQLEGLSMSSRKYENFRIQAGSRVELSEVLATFRPRIALITDGDDETIDHWDYYKFMSALAPTVEQLHPGEASTRNAIRLKPIDFPKLVELQYTVTNRSAFSIFLGSSPKLEKVLLSFSNDLSPEEFLNPTNMIHEFFKKNPQIKKLWMCEIDCAFQSDITENVNLDLRTFAFGKTGPQMTANVRDNLVKFVKAQRNLEWLKVLCMQDRDVFMRIWGEGQFKKLFIMDCGLKGALHSFELATNSNVDEINFYLNPSCHILKFLRATPNLKSFKIRQLSKQILEFAVQNLPRLETIQFQSVENNVVRHYETLRTSPGEDINRGINLEEMDFFEFVGRDAGF